VELGQIAFIAAVLGALVAARWVGLPPALARHVRPATAWAIGILAAFWFFERLAGFAA
jgi:hypothetical protein